MNGMHVQRGTEERARIALEKKRRKQEKYYLSSQLSLIHI